MALAFGKGLIKPPRWPIQPELTAAPWAWRDLLRFYALWERGGVPRDLAGSDHGTANTGDWTTTARGPAIDFASGEKVTLPTNALAVNNMTVEAWVIPDILSSPDSQSRIVFAEHWGGAGSASWKVGMWGGGGLFMQTHDGSTTVEWRPGGGVFSTEALQQAVYTVEDGVEAKVYHNGSLHATTTNSSNFRTPFNGAVDRSSLSQDSNTNQRFDGRIVILRVWGRVLSADEIGLLFVDPFAPIRPGPALIPTLFADVGGGGGGVTVPVFTHHYNTLRRA